MRLGQNPAKTIDHVPQPARITAAIITYIPFLNGYYEQSLEVLKVCLDSLWQNTSTPYDLLVFDNASCAEVRAYLQQAHAAGRIQYLILSDRNVGKGGGWNMIFQGAPGEIIAYADSDVYFYPGWLEASLDILENFPSVGMVTARPLRTPETYYLATLNWAQRTPGVVEEKGSFMPWDIYQEHTDSLGVSAEQASEWYDTTFDRLVKYQGRTAHIGAAHFQFIAYKQVLSAMGPLKMDRPMGQVRSLDERLNDAGYLRLGVAERLVKHMGNRLDQVEQKASSSGAVRLPEKTSAKPRSRLRNLPPVRRSLLWIYDQIFRLYYSK